VEIVIDPEERVINGRAKTMHRRDFLGRSSAAVFLGGIPFRGSDPSSSFSAASSANEFDRPARALRILILGGTGFIGPHQVRYALDRGHTVTLFNRGRTNTHLFPEVERLVGDRDGNLEALRGREWDVVLDNSGFDPRIVRDSARLLSEAVGHYMFVSTQSVYASRAIIDQDESGAVGSEGVPESEWEGYGPLKALCEREVEQAFSGRSSIIRPPVIVGPGDGSDRFTYWVDRIDRGGEVLAPGSPDDPTQFIDVRDLTHWMVRCLEDGVTGVYNATGPLAPLSMAEMLYGIRAVTTSAVSFTWVTPSFLEEHNVRPFSDMPLWFPSVGARAGFFRMNADRARAQGLTYRPLAQSASDTLEWWRTQSSDRRSRLSAGLSATRESEVLAAWHA
jgi:2'-hydroxyisoflavone reductase